MIQSIEVPRKAARAIRLAPLLGACLATSACLLTDQIRASAPPAKIVLVQSQPRLNDPALSKFNDVMMLSAATNEQSFTIEVRHGLTNALSVSRNGAELQYLQTPDTASSNALTSAGKAFYTISQAEGSDNSLADITITFPKVPNGTIDEYTIMDHSPNTGLPASQRDASISFTMGFVDKKPSIQSLVTGVSQDSSVDLRWNVKTASKIELFLKSKPSSQLADQQFPKDPATGEPSISGDLTGHVSLGVLSDFDTAILTAYDVYGGSTTISADLSTPLANDNALSMACQQSCEDTNCTDPMDNQCINDCIESCN